MYSSKLNVVSFLIPVLGRQGRRISTTQGYTGLHSKVQVNHYQVVRACINKQENKQTRLPQDNFHTTLQKVHFVEFPYNASVGELETGGFLGLSSQQPYSKQTVPGFNPASKNYRGMPCTKWHLSLHFSLDTNLHHINISSPHVYLHKHTQS